MYIVIIALENRFQATKTILGINHHITLVIEVDHPNKEIHEISHKIDIVDQIVETTTHDQTQTQHNLFQHPVTTQTEINIIQTINHEIHCNRNRNYSNNRNRNYSNNRNRSYSNNRNNTYPNKRSRKNSYNRPNYQRSNDNQHNTPKHQRQINQVQTNEEITSDPPGINKTENIELQVNHINCESTDSESDTGNNFLINMISVENDYDSVTYEEPFSSQIYENQLELLNNYYLGPNSNNTRTTQEVHKVNTENSLDKEKVQS